ncbi:hypothetical protein FGF1_03440 [Flavobacteriaceae bacterium GF1]
MELTIKGDERKLRRLAKEIRLRLKRDGLELSLKKESAGKSIPKKVTPVAKAPTPKKEQGGATGSKKDSK